MFSFQTNFYTYQEITTREFAVLTVQLSRTPDIKYHSTKGKVHSEVHLTSMNVSVKLLMADTLLALVAIRIKMNQKMSVNLLLGNLRGKTNLIVEWKE